MKKQYPLAEVNTEIAEDAAPDTPVPSTTTLTGEIPDGDCEQHFALKRALIECIQTAGELRPERYDAAGWIERLATQRFEVLALGEFKRGKSTLLNALIGDDLLPTGVIPSTAVTTVLTAGPTINITAVLLSGEAVPLSTAALADFVTELGNPANVKAVSEVRIEHPAELLKRGIALVDLPGVGSVHLHNTAVALAALDRCDAALFVLSADQPLGQAEIEFLRAIRRHSAELFILLNKTDHLSAAEVGEVVAFTRRALDELVGGDYRVIPVSARQALAARIGNDQDRWDASGFSSFLAQLDQFLFAEIGRIPLRRAAVALEACLADLRLERACRREALSLPLGELAARIDRFRELRETLESERKRLTRSFRNDVEHLIAARLDPALTRLRSEQSRQLAERFDRQAQMLSCLDTVEFDAGLAAFVAEEVRQADVAAGQELHAMLSTAAMQAAGEYAQRLAGVLEGFRQQAAALFQLATAPLHGGPEFSAAAFETTSPTFEPSVFERLNEGLDLELPGWFRGRLARLREVFGRFGKQRIAARRRRRLLEGLARQSGRLRYELLTRLEQHSRQLAEQFDQQLASVGSGLESTLLGALRERDGAASSVDAQRQALDAELYRIAVLQTRVGALRQQLAER